MKRIAELFYILFRTLFQIATWVVLGIAIIESTVRILDLDVYSLIDAYSEAHMALVNLVSDVLEMDASQYLISLVELYAKVKDFTMQSGLLVLILTFLGMYGCRFLQDHLERRTPVYLGVLELTAETTAWALKCLLGYVSVSIVCQGVSWLGAPDALSGFAEVGEVIEFLLSTVTTPLIFAGCAAVACLVCTGVSHKLAKN